MGYKLNVCWKTQLQANIRLSKIRRNTSHGGAVEAHCCFTSLCLQQPHREACEKLNGLEHSLINNSEPGITELQGTAQVLPALTWEGGSSSGHMELRKGGNAASKDHSSSPAGSVVMRVSVRAPGEVCRPSSSPRLHFNCS